MNHKVLAVITAGEYEWLDHTIRIFHDTEEVVSNTCSVPEAIAEAIKFMAKNKVRVLTVDGQTITDMS